MATFPLEGIYGIKLQHNLIFRKLLTLTNQRIITFEV